MTLSHPISHLNNIKVLIDELQAEDSRNQLIKARKKNKEALLRLFVQNQLNRSRANPLCLYDGIKLRSYNQQYIQWLQEDDQRLLFDLKPTLDAAHEMALYYQGKYQNMEIKIHYLQSGWAVDISGSIHNFFNVISKGQKQNYNDFYWEDFLKAYNEMTTVFKFDPKQVDVVNLEVGVNCLLPQIIFLPVAEIMECILSLFGVCKKKNWNLDTDRDTFKVKRGKRYLKFYDKTVQNRLQKQIVRLELGYERSRQIVRDSGAKSFYDLTKLQTLFALQHQLIEAFKTIHTSHPDLSNLPVDEIEADREILLYSKPSFWCKLKKENRYKHDQKRKKHEQLTNKYCEYNLSTVILNMLIDKLR